MVRKNRRQKSWTPERLERAAYHYLSRYASSRKRLEEILERKIRQSDNWAELTETQSRWIADIGDTCEQLGLIDDEAFAAAKARSLHRSGKSSRYIAAWLRSRGIANDVAEQALDDLAQEHGIAAAEGVDVSAAISLARKRRLGPFRKRRLPDDADGFRRKQKELSILARAGFSITLAKAIIEAEDEDSLDRKLDRLRENAGTI